MGADPFLDAVGQILRRARLTRGLTLHEVKQRSRGKFKPSSVGGYERAERLIPLDRFKELASIYGVPADRLLGKALAVSAPESRNEIVLDPARLPGNKEIWTQEVGRFVNDVRSRRGDFGSNMITLRSGDLEELALLTRLKPKTLVSRLRPALISKSDSSS